MPMGLNRFGNGVAGGMNRMPMNGMPMNNNMYRSYPMTPQMNGFSGMRGSLPSPSGVGSVYSTRFQAQSMPAHYGFRTPGGMGCQWRPMPGIGFRSGAAAQAFPFLKGQTIWPGNVPDMTSFFPTALFGLSYSNLGNGMSGNGMGGNGMSGNGMRGTGMSGNGLSGNGM
eukprot:138656_1